MSENTLSDALQRVRRIGENAGVTQDVIDALMHPGATMTASLI